MGNAYTTIDRVVGYLPTDLDGLSFNDPVYLREIDDWSRYVDDYLNSVYVVPFPDYSATPSTPRMITLITELLVVYDLYVRAGMAADKEDPRVNLWVRAHQMLDNLRNKLVTLAGADEDGSGIKTVPAVQETGPGTGPMSFAAQNRELGPPHGRTYGGLPLSTDMLDDG